MILRAGFARVASGEGFDAAVPGLRNTVPRVIMSACKRGER